MTCFSMPRRARTLALAVIALTAAAAIFASSNSSAVAADDTDAIAKMLAGLDDQWSLAAGKRDADLVASFYADNAVAYPPNAPAAYGRAAARDIWAAYFAEPTLKIAWKTNYSQAASSGDIGFTAGAYELTYSDDSGQEIHEVGKYLCTWEKQKDGSWKAVHDMWNADSF